MTQKKSKNKVERYVDAVGSILLNNRTEAEQRKVAEAVMHYNEAPGDTPDSEVIAILGEVAFKALAEQHKTIDRISEALFMSQSQGLPAEAHRRSFTFLKEWAVLIEELEDDADKLAMYEAIIGYGLDLTEPSLSPKLAKVFDDVVRPILVWDWRWHFALYGDAATEVEADSEDSNENE